MSFNEYAYPVAVSRLSKGERSREPQNQRAIKWLLDQPGDAVVVVTPQKRLESPGIKKLVAMAGVAHRTWKGLSAGSLANHRVLYAWPDRRRLNELWGVEMDALAVIEWSESDTAEWIDRAKPVQLLEGHIIEPTPDSRDNQPSEPLPNGVEEILAQVATWAAGYATGLKWNEEDKLKADMMNRPERWAPISVEQVREKCRELGMSPKDIDTIAGFLQRRKEGRRFNVRSTYRDFQFP